MTDEDVERGLIAFRDHLHREGHAADDFSDERVVDEMASDLANNVLALGRCVLPVASWDKRFVRSMASLVAKADEDEDLPRFTLRQAVMIARLRYRYRRQIKGAVPGWVVAIAGR